MAMMAVVSSPMVAALWIAIRLLPVRGYTSAGLLTRRDLPPARQRQ